ncbi:hypothetical protein JYU34_012012 [Plutella xylostella]|uniref:C2H2-type domain-containing protein n=1 Tax=Plutella xylostella TaxID=51655 RepID=A0ABQ7QHT1_PLUXY|nr:hypothetical protein JYU34_012012 [Plutella xylostella]
MKMSISTAIEERTEGDDDTSQESQPKDENENSDTENDNGAENQNGGPGSPEVHEITSDDEEDCVMTNEDDSTSSSSNESTSEAQHQRDKSDKDNPEQYDDEDMENGDEESDIEEVVLDDPLIQAQNQSKPIVINDTKNLVELAAKQSKSNDQNKPTVVIIDTNSIISGKNPLAASQAKTSISSSNSVMNAQNLCQSIAARGTTITPVSCKSTPNSHPTPASATAAVTPPILPSLTDDMFVVEAPSFIVPYVYEKPSVKPFREFVDTLGKELDEQKAKEDKERQEKEKAIKEKKEKERQERKDRGEEISEDEESEKDNKSTEEEPQPVKSKKEEKKEKKKRRNDEDDADWDGSSSDSEAGSDGDVVTIIKDKDDTVEEIKDVAGEFGFTKISGKPDSYFDCTLGQFFINIGINQVQEFVQTDLLKQQNRKLYREKKSGRSTAATQMAITSLSQNLTFSKKLNAPYTLTMRKCEFCSFKTESMLAMSHHLEAPHMKNNIYKCNSCPFEIRSPHDILYHMEAEHNLRGRLERAPAYQQCANCTFEDNSKSKLARHLIACAKKFKPEFNLMPPLEWEPPAKIPKLTRARNNAGAYGAAFGRPAGAFGRPPGVGGGQVPPMASRPRGRPPMSLAPRAAALPGAPLIRGGLMIMHNSGALGSNYPGMAPAASATPKISITPLPRSAPAPHAQPAPASKGTFVICEICDGYIKDLEQLRNHMQWIHKVKIHPKMIYNRPPLNCQKCQFRFFTDQGLERHLLGSHGLVTSSMQEAANKGKDAGRCPVCGRVYQWKLLGHVARDHSMTLKPAHLSYKCTVCTATFGMYKQFENHVYSAHSVVAKRVMDKGKPTPAREDSLLKPIKINDEITIIPQPAKPLAASSKDK